VCANNLPIVATWNLLTRNKPTTFRLQQQCVNTADKGLNLIQAGLQQFQRKQQGLTYSLTLQSCNQNSTADQKGKEAPMLRTEMTDMSKNNLLRNTSSRNPANMHAKKLRSSFHTQQKPKMYFD